MTSSGSVSSSRSSASQMRPTQLLNHAAGRETPGKPESNTESRKTANLNNGKAVAEQINNFNDIFSKNFNELLSGSNIGSSGVSGTAQISPPTQRVDYREA